MYFLFLSIPKMQPSPPAAQAQQSPPVQYASMRQQTLYAPPATAIASYSLNPEVISALIFAAQDEAGQSSSSSWIVSFWNQSASSFSAMQFFILIRISTSKTSRSVINDSKFNAATISLKNRMSRLKCFGT